MNNPFFFVLFLAGAVFILIGFIQLIFPPKKINQIYGYRTSSSMKDKRSWGFAQNCAAKEMIKLGVAFTLISFIGLIFNPDENLAMVLGVTLIIAMVTIFIIRVEKAIKKNFRNEVVNQ